MCLYSSKSISLLTLQCIAFTHANVSPPEIEGPEGLWPAVLPKEELKEDMI